MRVLIQSNHILRTIAGESSVSIVEPQLVGRPGAVVAGFVSVAWRGSRLARWRRVVRETEFVQIPGNVEGRSSEPSKPVELAVTELLLSPTQ